MRKEEKLWQPKPRRARPPALSNGALLKLSPFELKDKLISLAAESERESDVQMLNAGRGNPNWICTTPREAFGTLLRFGIEESRRGVNIPDLGRMPEKEGIAQRFAEFLADQQGCSRRQAAARCLRLRREDAELRRRHVRLRTRRGRSSAACIPCRTGCCAAPSASCTSSWRGRCAAGKPPPGRFDLFAVEGGTAAMCYIFDSLMLNRLLHRGDTIALGRADVHAVHRDPALRPLRASRS